MNNQNTPPVENSENAGYLVESPTFQTELLTADVIEAPEFLPIGVRRVLYVLALAGAVAAPVLGVSSPEYAVAITTGAGLLSVAALGTALANPSRK